MRKILILILAVFISKAAFANCSIALSALGLFPVSGQGPGSEWYWKHGTGPGSKFYLEHGGT